MRFITLFTATFAAVVSAYPAAPVISQVDSALDQLGLGVHNSVQELVDALGLHKTDAKLVEILTGEVQTVDNVVNGLDKVVDGLLEDLGEGDLVKLTNTLESELGLSSTNTIGDLLKSLHIL